MTQAAAVTAGPALTTGPDPAAEQEPTAGPDPAVGWDPAAGWAVHRPMLLGLAYRLLGSVPDAEDVVQDAYLRWARADREDVVEPRRFLSRIVTRLALDRLRARQARRETYVGQWLPEPIDTGAVGPARDLAPIDAVEQRESLSIVTLHLLERLNPAERAVYVLRTAFEVPYAEIAETLHRAPEDCRQLFHRATAAIGSGRPRFPTTAAEKQRLLDGLLDAARNGDLARLMTLLAADATVLSDSGGKVSAARNPVVGAEKVARFLVGVYGKPSDGLTVTRVQINGEPGILVRHPDGRRYLVVAEAGADRIHTVFVMANPDRLTTWASTDS